MNSLQSHEKSDRVKWIAVAVALLLLLGAVGAVIGLGAKHNGWFSVPEDDPSEGGMEIESDASGSGITLMSVQIPRARFAEYGIATIADSAYTLTATVTPDDAENKKVTYSVAWSNPSSEWASGKTVTEYVTVAQESEGSLKATLTCLKAFGEKVVVKVVSQANSSATATADVHYKQRTSSYILYLSESGNAFESFSLSNTGIKTSALKADFGKSYNLSFFVTVKKTTVYTKENDDTVTKVVFTPSSAFKSAITGAGLSDTTVTEKTANLTSLSGSVSGILDSAFGQAIYASSAANKNNLIEGLKSFAGTAYTVALYNGASKVAEFTLTVDSSVISGQKMAEGLKLDKTEIVF